MTAPADTLEVAARGASEIHVARAFAAPSAEVFRAMTEAALLARWLTGPAGWTTTECTSDARPGGSFRHAWRHDDGHTMAMRGTYREVDAPARLVRTEAFEFGCEAQAVEHVSTLTLTEEDGRTRLALVVDYGSAAARDAALASGMERGLDDGYRRLDTLLAASARA